VRTAGLAVRLASDTDPYEGADLRDSIVRALGRLGGRQRAAVVLTDYLGYSSPEAASLLGIKRRPSARSPPRRERR